MAGDCLGQRAPLQRAGLDGIRTGARARLNQALDITKPHSLERAMITPFEELAQLAGRLAQPLLILAARAPQHLIHPFAARIRQLSDRRHQGTVPLKA